VSGGTDVRDEALLEVRDLRLHFVVYGGVLAVLDGASLFIQPGEKVGLVGETGCGKTTTMKAILRVLPASARVSSGRITFMGRDIMSMGPRELAQVRGRGISMIFQDPTAALNPVFSVGFQMREVMKQHEPDTSRQELDESAASMLDLVGIPRHERALAGLVGFVQR